MDEIKNETLIITTKYIPHHLIEIQSKRQQLEGNHIPHDLIEIILFRLPAKSLLRFKAVCKQWKATISGYRFAETRLRLSKNSSCLYLEEVICPETRVRLIEFDVESDEFRVLSAVYHPPLKSTKTRRPIIKCHCDGLYVVSSSIAPNQNEYVLWNPSCRRLKKLCLPHIFGIEYILKYGMCYDPLIKDYKIVVFDGKRYAVFYCRNNSWSETKEMNVHPLRVCNDGVPLNGSIYWVSEVEDPFEVVCFDEKYEEFKNVLKLEAGTRYAHLISSFDDLYLSCYKPNFGSGTYEIVIMKRAGDDETWTKIKAELRFFCYNVVPLCLTLENKLLFWVYRRGYGGDYLLYNFSKMSFKEFQNSLGLEVTTSNLFPYVENLFSI